VTHDGFIAGETVDVGIIDDRVLTTTSADAGGRATADIVLSGPVGQRIDLYMRGRTSGSGARQTVEIGGVIVTTGTEATPIGRLALVVLTTGVLVVLGRRRRLV